jgi:hypothetical protein
MPCSLPFSVAQVFLALKDLHRTVVHGDVNPSNIVWDPSGHFFQFVDLEFSTWPGKVLVAPVATSAAAAEPPDNDAATLGEGAADSLDFHSVDLPTPTASASVTQQMNSPRASYSQLPPSPLGNAEHSSGQRWYQARSPTPPAVSPSKPQHFHRKWPPDFETSPRQGPRSLNFPSTVELNRNSSRPHTGGGGFSTPKGPRSHDGLLSPSPRDPFPFVPGPNSSTGGVFSALNRGSSTPGGTQRPAALEIPRSPMRSAQSGGFSFPGGVSTPGGRSTPGDASMTDKLSVAKEDAPLKGCAASLCCVRCCC